MTLIMRPATSGDSLDILRWRNDPVTRSVSKTVEPVAEDVHAAWFTRALADPDTILFVGEEDGAKVGIVRFDHQGGNRWNTSINVAPELRGKAYGKRMLAAAVALLLERTPSVVTAEIHDGNAASRAVFEACGFKWTGTLNGFEQFRLVPGSPAIVG